MVNELDPKALTKIQTVFLVVVAIFAGFAGVVAYIIFGGQNQISETIKIGICADLDLGGQDAWQGAVLAAEQVNAEGGVLGRLFEIVAEDDDSGTPPYDVAVMTNALKKLITANEADFIFTAYGMPIVAQDICADHNIIHFSEALQDELTQRVAKIMSDTRVSSELGAEIQHQP